jgi:endogenous inhibitor of DNA gyrase (YacG/DUF329 family)
MSYRRDFNQSEQPSSRLGAASGSPRDLVPASAQQAPDAIRSCPVCGQPYTSESLPTFHQHTSDTSDAAGESGTAEERLILLCPSCGTYSVGRLDGRGSGD